MDRTKFVTCIGRLRPLQAVYLKFLSQSGNIPGLKELLRATRLIDGLSFANQDHDMIGLMAVAQSGRWEDVSRTVCVFGMSGVPKISLETIADSLESVSAGDHYAKDLFTGSKHRQQVVWNKIAGEVLDDVMRLDVEEWGLTITSELIQIEDIPAIKFTILKGSSPVVRLCIDGFSGRVMRKGEWGDPRCLSAKQIQDEIRKDLDAYIDRATAVAA